MDEVVGRKRPMAGVRPLRPRTYYRATTGAFTRDLPAIRVVTFLTNGVTGVEVGAKMNVVFDNVKGCPPDRATPR
jgi:hypothetical protein